MYFYFKWFLYLLFLCVGQYESRIGGKKNKFKAEKQEKGKKQKRWAEFFLPVIYPIMVYFIQDRFRFRRDTWGVYLAMWWEGG